MQRRLSGQALRRLLGALRGCYSPAEAQLAPSAALANLPLTLSTQRLAWSSCTRTHGLALQAPGAVAQWQAARVRRSVLLSCKAVLYWLPELVQPVDHSAVQSYASTSPSGCARSATYLTADPTMFAGSMVDAARTGGASSSASPAHSATSDAERRWC